MAAAKKIKAQSQIESLETLQDETDADILADVLMAARGATGTKIFDGVIDEEYNRELSGQKGMETYDKMRRSDAQVSAILLAMELPIRSAYWYIDPAKDENDEVADFDKEVADFVQEALFEKLQDGFDNKLREILTMLPFGFSVFEKVYTGDGERVWIDKLGFRKQTTIMRWMTKDRFPGITQWVPTAGPTGEYERDIPGAKLLVFTYRKEGDNYQGISVLRSAYKNYYMKDRLYRFDAVKHERQGVGIPVIYIPSKATKEQKLLAASIVRNIRATEQTGIVMPGSKDDGWAFEFANLNAGTGSDLWESIKHHNREIAKNVLAQFMELWDTDSGSRSLGADQSDLFISSLTAVANGICEILNQYLVRELVDLNFDVKKYPKLRVQRISKQDMSKLSETINTLVAGGIINTDENIEDFMREALGLPARQKDETMGTEEPGADEPNDDDVMTQLEELAGGVTQDDEEGFAELAGAVVEFSETALEFVAKGGHLSDETKKKISEALMGRGNGDLKDTAGKATAQASKTKDSMDKVSAQYDKAIAGARTEVANLKNALASVPKGTAGKAARQKIAGQAKAILEKIRTLKGDKVGNTKALGVIRAKQLTTAKEAKKILKERKTALRAEIKAIRESVQTGKTAAKDAVASLQEKITANRSNLSDLREALKDIPKGDPRREAIQTTIDGLNSENMDIKAAQGGIRTSSRTIAETAKKTIDKKKTDSGLFEETLHDHAEHCEIGDELPSVFSDEFFTTMSREFNNDRVTKLIRNAKDDESRATIRKLGFRFNDFEANAPRPLTFAEKKVNLSGLISAMDGYTKLIEGKLEEITARQKEDLLSQVKKAIEANDIKAIGEIKAKYTGELAREMENIMKDVFEVGKKTAAAEMAVAVAATPQEVRAGIKVQAQAVVDKVVAEMENGIKTAVTQAVQKNAGSVTTTGTTEAVAAAAANLDKAIEGAKATITSLWVTGTINMGRAFIFERNPEKIYAFQFSAILDARTTDTCRSLDGRIVKPGSSEYYDYSPPRHYRCRSIWVEILQDEVFKPAIDGIPSSIPKNPTIDTFKDLQAPIILQNSPAVKVVQAELEERKKKLADLETLNQYPNRQDAHRKRIAELEASLKGIKQEGDQKFFEGAKKSLENYGVKFQ